MPIRYRACVVYNPNYPQDTFTGLVQFPDPGNMTQVLVMVTDSPELKAGLLNAGGVCVELPKGLALVPANCVFYSDEGERV